MTLIKPSRPHTPGTLPLAKKTQHRAVDNSPAHSSNDWPRRAAAAATAVAISLQAVLGGPVALPPALAAETLEYLDYPTVIATPDTLNRLPPIPTVFPPLPPIKLPVFHRMVLKNGLRVVLLQDPETPLVRGTLLIKGGQRASPANQVGLASIAAAVQRNGGSVALPGNALDDELEELAAAIEGGAGADALSFGFSCEAADARRVLTMFSELITAPAVPERTLELFKAQSMNSLAHKNDNIDAIPAREAAKLIYGPESPYAREPTLEGVGSITVDDVKAWLTQWERPEMAVLGIVGNYDLKEMQRLVEAALGKDAWGSPANELAGPAVELPSPPLPEQSGVEGRVLLVDRPGSTQAAVAMAEPGIAMRDPDEQALDVLSGVLNGFGGSLFNSIRSRDGLAYSVGAGWPSAPPDHPGLFLATAQTGKPVELLRELRGALRNAAESVPSGEEVNRAKEESLNSFIFGFASSMQQLRRAVAFDLFGISGDYLFEYRSLLEKVTADDVAAAAGRHLHPDKMVIVVAADAKVVRPQLERLGMVVETLRLD